MYTIRIALGLPRFFRTQYQLSLRAGFGRQRAMRRAVRSFFRGF